MRGIGFAVPHLRSLLTVVAINQISAEKGVSPPNGMFNNLLMRGKLPVVKVCVPGPNVSKASPPFTKIACCPSPTINCEEIFISSLGYYHTKNLSERVSFLISSINAI